MSPRVSIVVPSFNSVEYIDEALSSILAQTFTDFELIVSDHTSTDGTWERIQKYADHPQVRLMRVPAGGGAPRNWKAVTDEARGEFIKLVCGDDVVYPTCVAEQVAAFEEHEQAVLVASQRDILDQSGRVLVAGRGVQGLRGLVSGEAAIRQTVRSGTNVFGEPVCVMARRDVLMDAGGWDDRSPYLIDQATCARVLLRGPMVAIRHSLAGFRVNPGQWSVKLAQDQASHARAFHHQLARENPGLLSRADLGIGDARATVMAFARRAVYLWLRLRAR